MPKKLTIKLKRKIFPVIKNRDGDICFFCVLPFVQGVEKWRRTYHHLNKNTEDQRPENLVFAHAECNRKVENDTDWQICSKQKLEDNLKYHQYAEEVTAHNDEDKDTNVEIDTNELYLTLGKKRLVERLKPIGTRQSQYESISFRDTCNSIAYLVFEEVGHGSPIGAGRALDILCSDDSDFDKYKELGGKWRIRLSKK